MTPLRHFTVVAALLAGLTLLPDAQAWVWPFGAGERVSGSGEIASESRDPGRFDAITLKGNFKLLVRQAGTEALVIRADRNLLPLVETRVIESSKGRTLEIGPRRGQQLVGSVPIQITVDVMTLNALAIAGAGDARIESLKTPRIDVSISGSGDVRLSELASESASLRIAGSGDIQASGRVDKLSVSVAGSGDVRVQELVAEDIKVRISGSGDVRVQARRTLDVGIAGSGDVRYLGAPTLSTSIAGSGSVKSLGN